ncbi:hypothetical protein CSC70_03120 [Pseudoxanthomonas kalamensis DSM 18571]|nr:hypothetical protein CSC70_03120 [Pseudoxanthomonas kalamensis DSM 18571]
MLVLTALVWCTVLLYWQVNDIRPGARDIALYLGVLPVGMFAVAVLLRRGLRSAADKAKASDTVEGDDTTTPEAAAAAAEPVDVAVLAIRAGALRLPAGGNASDVEQAARESRQAGLHGKLKDASGFPVFAAWVEDADAEAGRDWWAGLAGEPPALDDEQWRALSLLQPVARELLERVAADGLLDAPEPPSLQRRREPLPAPSLQVRLQLPADWNVAVREGTRALLQAEASACGLPSERVAFDVQAYRSPTEAWQWLQALQRTMPDIAAPPTHYLWLGCDSQLGERSVQRLQSAGRLMDAATPEGQVPGEGAAGLLLTVADRQAQGQPLAQACGLVDIDQGVSWRERTAQQQVAQMLAQVFARAGAPDKEVVAVVSDADHRKSRRQISAAVASGLDAVDPEEGQTDFGMACGSLGAAAAPALLALAAARAEREQAPVLALGLCAESERIAALLLPPHAAEDEPDAPAGHGAA